MQQFRIGERVLVDGGVSGQGRIGIIRYYGPTQFREGQWVGIELDEPTGKNDGSVEGVTYFRCPKDYGLFVHPSKVSSLSDPLIAMMAPKPKPDLPQQSKPREADQLYPPPPFQLSEASVKILEMSREFGKENLDGKVIDRKDVEWKSAPIVDSLPSTVTLRSSNEVGMNPLLLTPPKQYIHREEPMTPFTTSKGGLAHELAKRQAEVNHIRRHVEPLILSAKSIVERGKGDDQQSNLQAIVIKLSSHMRDYDKVISRYERQLSKILEHQNNSHRSLETEEQLTHELDLVKTQLLNAEEQAKSLESRLALTIKAGEQQDRSIRNSTSALVQELSDEKAALEQKVLRLEAEASVNRTSTIGSTSQSVMIEELRRELEAERRLTRDLKEQFCRDKELTTGVSADDEDLRKDYEQLSKEHEQLSKDYKEITEAKFNESLYYEEKVKELYERLAKAQAQISETTTLNAALQHQIDTKLDAVYDGQKGNLELELKLTDSWKQIESLKARLLEVEEKKSKLEGKCKDLQSQLSNLSTKLVDNTRRSSITNPIAEVEEAKKQIAALEQELLHHTEQLARQKDSSKVAIQQGLAEMQRTLKGEEGRRAQAERRLAQVEHEKALIEEEVQRLRSSSSSSSTVQYEPERVQKIQAELAKKGPQNNQFSLLANFFSSLPQSITRRPNQQANLEGIRQSYQKVKEGLDRLEVTQEKTIDKLRDLVMPSMDGEEDVEKTPTVNRRISDISSKGIQGRTLFKDSSRPFDSSRGFQFSSQV